MKKLRNFKKNLFAVCLSTSILLSTVGICFAATKSNTYSYPNGYTMNYTIGSTKMAGKSAAYATTNVVGDDIDAYAYAALFSYKNGTCKNSGSAQQSSYIQVIILGNGGNKFKSVHALKYMDYSPMGTTQELNIKN